MHKKFRLLGAQKQANSGIELLEDIPLIVNIPISSINHSSHKWRGCYHTVYTAIYSCSKLNMKVNITRVLLSFSWINSYPKLARKTQIPKCKTDWKEKKTLCILNIRNQQCMHLVPSGVAGVMNLILMRRLSSCTFKVTGAEPINPDEGYNWALSKLLFGQKSKKYGWPGWTGFNVASREMKRLVRKSLKHTHYFPNHRLHSLISLPIS